MIERAPAVIGHVDAGDAVVEAELRVLGGLDALDDDLRFGKSLLEALQRAPVEPCKIAMLLDAAIGDTVMALHHVALAPRVMREVDREAELRRKSRGLRAVVEIVDIFVVAARIKLEDLESVGSFLRNAFRARLGR